VKQQSERMLVEVLDDQDELIRTEEFFSGDFAY
jgi:hypothetical protein